MRREGAGVRPGLLSCEGAGHGRIISQRLHKRVQTTQDMLVIPVQTETLEVERVAIGRWIEAPAGIRQEGDTTVYPVVEEVLVVEKRLRLVEEVRVTRRWDTRQVRETVSLRREEILVERDAAPERDPGP